MNSLLREIEEEWNTNIPGMFTVEIVYYSYLV